MTNIQKAYKKGPDGNPIFINLDPQGLTENSRSGVEERAFLYAFCVNGVTYRGSVKLPKEVCINRAQRRIDAILEESTTTPKRRSRIRGYSH